MDLETGPQPPSSAAGASRRRRPLSLPRRGDHSSWWPGPMTARRPLSLPRRGAYSSWWPASMTARLPSQTPGAPSWLGPREAGAQDDPVPCPEASGRLSARRLLFPAVFLAVLLQTAAGVSHSASGWGVVAGDTILVGFCVAYLFALTSFWAGRIPRFWFLYGLMIALWLSEMYFAHGDAFIMTIFIAVLSIAWLGHRAAPVVAAMTAAAVFGPAAFPSWHEGVQAGAALTIVMVNVAMYSFFALVRANQELTEARSEVAGLAAENERARIARDIHDLLGHSLTTITVKAGLARRLSATDPQRSAAEIAEVEELARQSLNDVRAAVTNYREVSLAGELAAGRELLRAAGIEAHLPGATDVVDPAHQTIFAWVLREGLTNVVRHAHATSCTVTLTAHSLDLVDNGIGGEAQPGNGLSGLRERVVAAGATLQAGPVAASGWRLHVDAAPSGSRTAAGEGAAGPTGGAAADAAASSGGDEPIPTEATSPTPTEATLPTTEATSPTPA